jgi:hypothetical protein
MTPDERLAYHAEQMAQCAERMESRAIPRTALVAVIGALFIAIGAGSYGYADLSARVQAIDRDARGNARFHDEAMQLQESRDKAMSIRLEAIAAKLGVRFADDRH